jgi:hypothetical protein
MNYGVAYCNSNGVSFSNTEPYIKEGGTTLKECEMVLSELVNEGCCQLTPFEMKDDLESYTWEYVNKHKIFLP